MEDEEFEKAMQENIKNGHMEEVGVDKDGNKLYRVTEAGKKWVASNFGRNDEGEDLH